MRPWAHAYLVNSPEKLSVVQTHVKAKALIAAYHFSCSGFAKEYILVTT